jgi:S1-C subfamily serine protease
MRDQKSDSPQLPGYMQQCQGSGLIFLGKGFILTNAHVVEDANKVSVTLTDGQVFHCQVMGWDEIVDIAVLKMLNGNNGGPPIIANLPVAKLGDSDSLSVGKIVIAVGSPGQYGHHGHCLGSRTILHNGRNSTQHLKRILHTFCHSCTQMCM